LVNELVVDDEGFTTTSMLSIKTSSGICATAAETKLDYDSKFFRRQ